MKKCLIVDDSRVIRKVSRHMVETLGLDVLEAGDGQEALTQCDQEMPDVILLDWNMPVMSGIEFIKGLHFVAAAGMHESYFPEGRKYYKVNTEILNRYNRLFRIPPFNEWMN